MIVSTRSEARLPSAIVGAILLFAISGPAPSASVGKSEQNSAVVNTAHGPVRGLVTDTWRSFRGEQNLTLCVHTS